LYAENQAKNYKDARFFSLVVVVVLFSLLLISYYTSHHRLNGSSSHLLTATSHSYGKAKNSTPHRIEIPNLIEMKFGTVDYVGEATPSAKFHANPFMGGFSANG